MSKPIQIKDTINDLLKNIKKNNKIDIEEVEEIFKKTLDKRVLKHINFVNLKDEVLKIKVDASPWLYELHLRKPDILNILKEKFPEQIKDIKIFIGELR